MVRNNAAAAAADYDYDDVDSPQRGHHRTVFWDLRRRPPDHLFEADSSWFRCSASCCQLVMKRNNDSLMVLLLLLLFGVSPPPSLLELAVMLLPGDCLDSGHDHSETKKESPVPVVQREPSSSSSALLRRQCYVVRVDATLPFRSTKTKATLLIYSRLAFLETAVDKKLRSTSNKKLTFLVFSLQYNSIRPL